MRIAHFLISMKLEGGGVVRAVIDLVGVLARSGLEVTLLTFDRGELPSDWISGETRGIRVVELPGRADHRSGQLLSRAQLDAAGDALKQCDLLHLHGAWDVANAQLARLARRRAVPYVISPHGMLDEWAISHKWLKKRIYFTLLGRRMFERAAAVHCTAEAEAEQARQWIRPRRLEVLPLALDLTAYRQLPDAAAKAADIPVSGRSVLFLSRVHPVKRVEIVIEAIALLRRAGREVILFVAGDGEEAYMASLKNLAAKLGVAEAVQWLGMVRGERKLLTFRMADVFALPTFQENFGMVLVESMACGTPVVTTRGVDIWRELESAGATIADATPEAFADAIARLLDDEPDRLDRGRRGREWVLGFLDSDRLAAGYAAFYRSLAGA